MKPMNTIDTLIKRKSVRSYTRGEVDPSLIKKMINAGNCSKGLYPNIHYKITFIEDGKNFYRKLEGLAGYLGKMIDAPHYIIAESSQEEGFLENLGYRFEQLIIEAQREGLGTCWIEILQHQEKIKNIIGHKEKNNVILALTPIGFEMESKGITKLLKERSVRKDSKETVFMGKWGINIDLQYQHKYIEILEHARFAPSWANQQPWMFIISDKMLIINVKKDMKYKDAWGNINRIDAGVIMLYISLLASDMGIKGDWIKPLDINPDSLGIPKEYEPISIFTPYIDSYHLL